MYGSHSAVIRRSKIYTAGKMTSGELGFGNPDYQIRFVELMSDCKSVAAGENFNFVVKNDGTLWAWGINTSNELGSGNAISLSIPTQIGIASDWNTVKCGSNNTIVTKVNGSVYFIGINYSGERGDGTITILSTPTLIPGDWMQVIPTQNATFGIKSNGTLWGTGYYRGSAPSAVSTWTQIGVNNTWTQITGGYFFMIGLKDDGLWAMGDNNSGQLGDGTTTDRNSLVKISSDTSWKSIHAGNATSYALKANGDLWAWGNNGQYNYGNGLNINFTVPTIILNLNFDKLFTGPTSQTVFGIKQDGSLWGWGYNIHYQLGLGNTLIKTRPIQIGTDIYKEVGVCPYRSYPLKLNGILTTAGKNSITEPWLGIEIKNNKVFNKVPLNYKFKNVSTGISFTTAITEDGALWSWGINGFGELGQGHLNNNFDVPAQVGNKEWTQISCGTYHTIAIKKDGSLWSWGYNAYGQLGEGTNINKNTPTRIGLENNWAQISCGDLHTIAIKKDGSLWSWGYNVDGQLGNNNTNASLTPIQIGIRNDWVQVLGCYQSSYAIKEDGTLWAWGNNNNGQLGLNNFTSYSNPQCIKGFIFKNIFAGYQSIYAIKEDGTLWAWGNNDNNHCGNGNATVLNVPTQIGTDLWLQIISGSDGSTLGIKQDRTLWIVGNNNYGQLGDGTISAKVNFIKLGTFLCNAVMSSQVFTDTRYENDKSLFKSTNGKFYTYMNSELTEIPIIDPENITLEEFQTNGCDLELIFKTVSKDTYTMANIDGLMRYTIDPSLYKDNIITKVEVI